MSFFGKLKGNAVSSVCHFERFAPRLTDDHVHLKTPASPTAGTLPPKKDATIPQPTPLEKHIADLAGPVRPDGSDKFFGFENVSEPVHSQHSSNRLIVTCQTVRKHMVCATSNLSQFCH